MYISLLVLILNLFFANARIPADAATGPVPTERTQEDQQIDDECAPRMRQGVDHYAECVAEKGREAERRRAEARRMMEINEAPYAQSANEPIEPPPPMVCNPQGALNACNSASQVAARMNNPSSTDQEIRSSLQSCRAACNPSSSQVLRNYFSGCRGDLSSQKQVMMQTMNNCGTGTSSTAGGVQQPAGGTPPDESSWTGWAASKFSALSTQAGNWWTNQVDQQNAALQAQREAEAQRLMAINEIPYSSKTSSSGAGAGIDPFGEPLRDFGSTAPPPNAEDYKPKLSFGEDVSADPDAATEYNLGTTGGTSGSPAPQAGNPAPTGGGNGGSGSGSNSGSSPDTSLTGNNGDQQVVTPVGSNEPINYQAGNFAGLQSAMSSPAGGGMASSSSAGGEVSRGGSSGGGSYPSQNGSTRPLAFEGSGQVSRSALRGNETPAVNIAGGGAAAIDVAAPMGSPRGGGLADFGGGGRMMAAARTGPASLEASMAAPMRSDSFYRTGSGGAVARPAARSATSCKGPNCAKPPRPRGIAAANCDGNPQCLLALTGKLQRPKIQGAESEEFLQFDSRGVRRLSTRYGERGIASIPKRTEPGGVVRGKIQDVLNHLGSSEVFKLDHDGMLEVDL